MVDRYNSRGMFKGCAASAGPVPTFASGCKSGKGNRMNDCNNDCKKLLERLREIDFSMIDTVLYLDAYPHSCEALAYYNKIKKERCDIVKTLSESCNMPMTSFDNSSDTAWLWTDAPWPWEPSAN